MCPTWPPPPSWPATFPLPPIPTSQTRTAWALPHINKGAFFPLLPETSLGDNSERPPSQKAGDYYTTSPDLGSARYTPKPDTPVVPEHAEDDIAVSTRPSKQVDYLSHGWREEDIWSSWRYIVNRSDDFPDRERLKNALWRTWIKAKANLTTIPPESLNWLKDCDITWLYGPLQPGPKSSETRQNSIASTSHSTSLANFRKKSSLKRRSMPEVQRSLSKASLLKQAATVGQAQGTKSILRRSLVRDKTDTAFSSRRMSDMNRNVAVSSSKPSGFTSPGVGRKHIHFNEQVVQCIAIEVKGADDDEMEPEQLNDASDSSDSFVMMTRSRSRNPPWILNTDRKKPQAPGIKTIEMLPSATLKYRKGTPEPRELTSEAQHWSQPLIPPPSFEETPGPSRKGRFSFNDDDDDMVDIFCDPTSDWDTACDNGGSNLHSSTSSASLTDVPTGMRRTPSGMFMPYDEGKAAATVEGGILGRIVDMYSTVQDISHVMWNVVWKK